MIIFLYGPDSYRRRAKEKEVVREYCKRHSGLTVQAFSADEQDQWALVRAYTREVSLFGGSKLAVLQNLLPLAEKEDIAFIKAQAAGGDTGTALLFSEDVKPLKACAFLLKAPVVFQEFDYLSGDAYRDFIVSEARARGVSLLPREVALLSAQYPRDSWGVVTALDRLAYEGARTILAPETALDFITCIKALAYGGVSERIVSLERLMEHEDPAKTFNMLAAFVAGEKKRRMADYDIAIKRGALDYAAALLDFAIA